MASLLRAAVYSAGKLLPQIRQAATASVSRIPASINPSRSSVFNNPHAPVLLDRMTPENLDTATANCRCGILFQSNVVPKQNFFGHRFFELLFSHSYQGRKAAEIIATQLSLKTCSDLLVPFNSDTAALASNLAQVFFDVKDPADDQLLSVIFSKHTYTKYGFVRNGESGSATLLGNTELLFANNPFVKKRVIHKGEIIDLKFSSKLDPDLIKAYMQGKDDSRYISAALLDSSFSTLMKGNANLYPAVTYTKTSLH